MFCIVPHAAEVERFFSNLSGVHSQKQSKLTILHLQTLATLHNHYTCKIQEEAFSLGKMTCRKHSHIHALPNPGIDVNRANSLVDNFTHIPLVTGYDNISIDGSEMVTTEDIDREFDKLEKSAFNVANGDKLGSNVSLEQVYDILGLDKIWLVRQQTFLLSYM
ncbi:hypothetical protein CVT25_000320 [Psilocybe cyanescens]|uniref:HAT C-terminal dimerisation domain-containing protein n=1 Tax=Psilocybe cyanescens TaxID=93625 RepID=A0A409XEX6_PSICY|nr:hypothetical protein CVT25_000320 [Psilocybe cyanescens]